MKKVWSWARQHRFWSLAIVILVALVILDNLIDIVALGYVIGLTFPIWLLFWCASHRRKKQLKEDTNAR